MRFKENDIAILNEKVVSGLPHRVGEMVTVIDQIDSFNYDYQVKLDDGDLVRVKDRELNKPTEEQLQLMSYIKRGNKVLYAATNKVVEIVKVDFLYGVIEVKFEEDGSMCTVGLESVRKMEEAEEVRKETLFQIGDKVRTITLDHWGGLIGEVKWINYYDDNTPEYLVDINDKIGCPFAEHELELHKEEIINGHTKEYWLDLFFGHYENGEGMFVLPRQLVHNLIEKLI